jgi:hypothetical protein
MTRDPSSPNGCRRETASCTLAPVLRDQASFVEILELTREDLRGTHPLKQNFSRLELIPFHAV